MLKNLFGASKKNYFNQALEEYRKIGNHPGGGQEILNIMLEIIRLCQLAIQENKNDGDAHVLLANIYLLSAMNNSFSEGYSFFLARAAATIQAVKTRHMYIKNNQIADSVYKGIINQLTDKIPDWVKKGNSLPNDMDKLEREYYAEAISSFSFNVIRGKLIGE